MASGVSGTRPIAAALTLLCSLIGGNVFAQVFDFTWDVPQGCPPASFIEGEVTRVTGQPWSELGAKWQRAQASVTPVGKQFRLQVTVEKRGGGASERSLMAASCTEATEAVVAILSAGMAASLPAERSSSQITAAPEPVAPAASNAPISDNDTSAAAAGGLDVRPVLAARLGVDVGTLVATAPFAQIVFGVALERFALYGFAGGTGRVLGEVSAGVGAQMFLLMGGALGCFEFLRAPRIAAAGCGGIELGSLEASGYGAGGGRDGRAFWSASLGQGVLDWHLSEGSMASLGVGAVVPFRRLNVVLTPEEVHRVPAISGRAWLGLGFRFR
jgi:hypothetical protein